MAKIFSKVDIGDKNHKTFFFVADVEANKLQYSKLESLCRLVEYCGACVNNV
jgi:hypothetical protein